MKLSNTLLLLVAGLMLIHCKNTTEDSASKKMENTAIEKKAPAKPYCIYVPDADRTVVGWTAYKTTEKVPVNGKFDIAIFKTTQDTFRSMPAAIMNTVFTIVPSSVNSGNKERDPKLVNYFFKNLGTITGKFVDVQENGTGRVQMDWAGLNMSQPFEYRTDADTLWITTKIKFDQWKLGRAAAALNKACKVLHTGKDGKSKLWPEADVKTKVVFKKYCSE